MQTPGGCGVQGCGRPAPIWAPVAQPAVLFLFPFPDGTAWAAGAGGSAGSPHGGPPRSCFHVSDCFFPPWVAKQLMKKPLSFAFLFWGRNPAPSACREAVPSSQSGRTGPGAPQGPGGAAPLLPPPEEWRPNLSRGRTIIVTANMYRGGGSRPPPSPRQPSGVGPPGHQCSEEGAAASQGGDTVNPGQAGEGGPTRTRTQPLTLKDPPTLSQMPKCLQGHTKATGTGGLGVPLEK